MPYIGSIKFGPKYQLKEAPVTNIELADCNEKNSFWLFNVDGFGVVIIPLELFADLVVVVEIERSCGASNRHVVLRAVYFSNPSIEYQVVCIQEITTMIDSRSKEVDWLLLAWLDTFLIYLTSMEVGDGER